MLDSSTKSKIIMRLRTDAEVSLGDLSTGLDITKVATLKHVTKMEENGLIQRRYASLGRGRPKCMFSLTEKGEDSLPKNYSDIALEALNFIDENFGRKFVAEILKLRTQKLVSRYKGELLNLEKNESVLALSRLRDLEGYMSSSKQLDESTFELIEYNCPILNISKSYSEACAAENQLFKEVISAEVESTHRLVSGGKLCRFVIKF